MKNLGFNEHKVKIFMEEGTEDYSFFKEQFEEWVIRNNNEASLSNLKKFIIEQGYNVLGVFEAD